MQSFVAIATMAAMADSKLVVITNISSLVLVIFFVVPAAGDDRSAPAVAPTVACNATLDPQFCKSVLPGGDAPPQTISGYGRFSVARSLSNAHKFLAAVDRYLSRPSELSPATVRALEDCKLLSELNVDFLTAAGTALNSSSGAGELLDPRTDGVQTLLSAILTNQQTCLDSLQETSSSWKVKNGLAVPLSNGNKLYSMSLALFNRAWVRPPPPPHTKKKHPAAAVRRGLLQSSSSSSSSVTVISTVVVVNKDGTGDFSSVSDAVASAPNGTKASGDGYYLIRIRAGVYEEYVSIPKNKQFIMMVGDGINSTVITGNRSVDDGSTTFNSATFAVVGQGFVAANITFRNTAGPGKHQAVAVRNGADLSAFYRCSFEGYQDTLYAHSLRQLYRDCDVYGTVDYVFGNAAVVFQGCRLYSRLPLAGQQNTVTAQGRTDPGQNTGMSMQNCSFLAAEVLAEATGAARTYLGRPWKAYSRTVVMESFIDAAVDPAGWLPWNGSFALNTLYYAEYDNVGPAAGTAGRVSWPGYRPAIDGGDAANFTVGSFILGDSWLPPTGVPFNAGL